MSAGAVEHATSEPPPGASRPHGKPSTAKTWLKAIELTSRIEANPNRLFADIIEDWAARQPDRPALMSDHATFSYRELNERIHRYARWQWVSARATPYVCCCRRNPITSPRGWASAASAPLPR